MLDYRTIKDLVVLANHLDDVGLYKEADAIDSIIKESSSNKIRNSLLGAAALGAAALGWGSVRTPEAPTPPPSVMQEEPTAQMTYEAIKDKTIADLGPEDFKIVIVKDGDIAEKIAAEEFPGIDVVTATNILKDSNPKMDLSKLRIGDKIKIPLIASIQEKTNYESTIGKGLVSVRKYQITPRLIDFIKNHEGCELKIYDTGAGEAVDLTIGWGHKIKPGEEKKFRRGITQQQADALFARDLRETVNRVNGYNLDLTENEFIALTSLAFNYHNMVPESIRQLILSGKKDQVPDKILEFTQAQGNTLEGLEIRRAAEAELFRTKSSE